MFVALGDSLTEGRGDPDGLGGFVGWPRRLLAQLPDGVALVNLARRNAEVSDVLDRQLPMARQERPTLLSVVVGVNDVCADFRPRSFADSFAALLCVAQSTCDTVITATLPDITQVTSLPEETTVLLRARLERANNAIRAAAERIVCLDLWELSRSWDVGCWCDDRLHPGPDGHQRIADGFRELLVARGGPWSTGGEIGPSGGVST
jgi:lysophospholipase L1-like esterase